MDRASADVGPIDPARKICMGLPAGTACTYEGKSGTCQGPHPSRMYCVPGEGSAAGSAAGSAGTTTGSAGTAAGSAPAADPAKPKETTTPAKQRGCAVADAGSAAAIGLAVVVLAVRWRRRRSRQANG